jgi:Rod binding domain-containing protein
MSRILPLAEAESVHSSPRLSPSRAQRAAQQFEAVLLNSLFGSLEHSFSNLPGSQSSPESDNYHALGIEALAASVAASGGLGIADRIVRSLLKNQPAEPIPGSGPAKVHDRSGR